MTQDDYRRLLDRRQAIRDRYAHTGTRFDAFVALTATGAAPVGLTFTGDSGMVVPGSLLGTPAISLPLLKDEGLPLGLQLLGLPNRDAELVAQAEWIWRNFDAA
jgi:Asp-tRNA(Asn)/Glu-tRNA(Gln) amidotransferase A subunit family amidase